MNWGRCVADNPKLQPAFPPNYLQLSQQHTCFCLINLRPIQSFSLLCRAHQNRSFTTVPSSC